MDFIDDVRTRSGRFQDRLQNPIETEEATKTSFVLPFIQMLGYDIFDPAEVVPEFVADIGIKQGERVDYALMQDGQPAILIECKRYGSNLENAEMSQLLRYFTSTEARIGILTDGITYRFFSDIDQQNVMDPSPFFEFNMLEVTELNVRQLKRFHKAEFKEDEAVDAARQLKYATETKQLLADELSEPSHDFVMFVMKNVYAGTRTKRAREMFAGVIRQAFGQLINDRLQALLAPAQERLKEQAREQAAEEEEDSQKADGPKTATTDQEIEGYMIVKAILREGLDTLRVTMRDTKSYCGILLDDTNRQPICRLHFNNPDRLSIGLFDDSKKETNHRIESLDQIYDHAEAIRRRARLYDQPPTATQ